MNKQEHNNHTNHAHGGHAHHAHHAGHHHDFKGIEQWINRLDHPERAKKQRPDEVIAQLGLQNNDVVADIGAGTGYFAIRIAEAYPQVSVIAADPEPEMVDYLKSQSVERNLTNLEPVIIDPFKPSLPVKATLALMVDTLHHIENRVEYLKLLCGNMAPSARIAVIDYSIEASEGPPAAHRIAISRIVDEFKQVGYKLQEDLKFLPNQYFLIFKEE